MSNTTVAGAVSGARVAQVRAALGVTRNELARLLRLSPASGFDTVRAWETSEKPVSGPVAVALEALEKGFRPAHCERSPALKREDA